MGLGLYNSVPAALVTEIGLFVAGIVIYLAHTKARYSTGTWAFWIMLLSGFLMALPSAVLPLGNWVDRHCCLASPKHRAA